MTDWTDHDALAKSLIEEIEAQFPQPMRPGDVTVAMYAHIAHVTASVAEARLKSREKLGELISERAVVPGARVPLRVWRKPS
jgi:hypothetical protein